VSRNGDLNDRLSNLSVISERSYESFSYRSDIYVFKVYCSLGTSLQFIPILYMQQES